MARSLRSAAPPIEIEIAADNRDAAVKAVRKIQRRPEAAPLAAQANAASVGANTRLRVGSKAEAIAWGQNDHADTANRYPFFCVWRFPDPTMGQAYIDVLAENGWNDYFATESIHGAPKTPFDVMTQHVLL